ncbi:MAG: UMP kinase [Deltaproteobacteria bacterium]|nr:UMP kinase [Deltaproteobacteria bacterium]
MDTVVISLGGSIIVPDGVDIPFLKEFRRIILDLAEMRFIIICGGGRVCREYQDAARELAQIPEKDLDWIGIRATRLNAELVRSIFAHEAVERIIHDPEEEIDPSRRIVIGAGFEPGSSTDLRAVELAGRFGASRVVNMSNVDHVYTADPRKDSDARKLTHVSWPQFRKLVGDKWSPGLNMPFDPIASRQGERMGLEVIIVGRDVKNLERLLQGETFRGTTIS